MTHAGASAQKTVLITGCSSGIGLASARMLRARGWRVFAACRKEQDCQRLRQDGFDSPRIDYQDEASIHDGLAQVVAITGGRLDALFNNGAFASPGAVEDMPTEGLRDIFEANLFGWHTLTRAVIPLMRAQGGGRIVQCSSILGFITLTYRGAYQATKFALEGLTDTMRLELRGSGVEAILIEPGPVDTMIRRNAHAHFRQWIRPEGSAHRAIYAAVEARLAAEVVETPYELPPEAVAAKLVHALESRRPRARYYVTFPTYMMGALKRLLPTRALDRLLLRLSR